MSEGIKRISDSHERAMDSHERAMDSHERPMESQPLTRPATMRRLWIGFGCVLLLTVMAQFFIEVPGSFPLSETFGFGAWYGFGVCIVLMLAARILGWLLMRPQDYYGSTPEEDLHD